MRKTLLTSVVLCAAIAFSSPAFAVWNASPIASSQIKVSSVQVSEAPNLYRVFATFSGSVYNGTMCGVTVTAATEWRVYGYGGATAIETLVATLTAAHLANRRVAVLYDGGCDGAYPILRGVSLLGP